MAAQPRKTGRKPTPKRRLDADGKVRVSGKAANGEGSVLYSAYDQRWEARAFHPGLGKRIKRTGATREEAIRRRDAALAETGSEHVGALGAQPTFAELVGYYLDQVAEPRVESTTLTTYRKWGSTLVGILGSRPVTTLTKADGQLLVNTLFRNHSYDYATGCKRLARRTVGEAVDLGYLSTDPLQRVQSPPRPEVAARRTLSLEEQRTLVSEALSGRYRHGVAVALLFTVGLRVSEVLGLRWEDFDYDGETVQISRALTYLDGKGPLVKQPKTKATKGLRHLPSFVHAPLRSLYKAQIEERFALGPHRDPEGNGFVFVGSRHQLVNRQAITKEINRICKATGIDSEGVATHTGRRTVITNLAQEGESTEDIAAAVGHADPSTTRGYVQSLGDRPTRTARRMADLLSEPS